jgi:hypothetical protein
MAGRETTINVDEKTIDITVDDISKSELKDLLSNYRHLNGYKIMVHNKKQSTDLIDVYEGDVNIDNLYKMKN